MTKKQKRVGRPTEPNPQKVNNFVQTERAAHEAWAAFTLTKPKASALLHFFVARLDAGTNAVVASHSTLASIMKCSVRSIKTYLRQLEEGKWIQIVVIGKGTSNAYVVNSYVAWAKNRDKLQYSTFSAQVIAARSDQSERTLSTTDLRSIPTMYDGEWQQPHGEGVEPPSQRFLGGLEPDLPAINAAIDESTDRTHRIKDSSHKESQSNLFDESNLLDDLKM
jgi:hypothetical protein